MPKKVVILGNSAAALSAVKAFRAQGAAWPITLVSREACPAYSPVLTTYYLREQIGGRGLFVCDEAFYREHEVDCRLGRTVLEVDSANRSVHLDDGSRLDYDTLLIATGASPRPLESLDPEVASEILYLRTLADARRIKEKARQATCAVVVGGGLVSLQVAAALARTELAVTVVVSSRQLLSQNIDAPAAAILQRHMERRANISFLFGTNVGGIARRGQAYEVALDTGEELRADLIVVGKGVVPNLDFLDEQVAVGRGILVDENQLTTAEGIYAAGDVAEGFNCLTGQREPVPNWINACEQGRIAGLNLAGKNVPFPGSLPENVTTFFGLSLASIGLTRTPAADSDLREVVYAPEGRNLYRKLVFRDKRPVGAILVGELGDVGVIRSSIAQGAEVGLPADQVVRLGVSQADRLRACIYGS